MDIAGIRGHRLAKAKSVSILTASSVWTQFARQKVKQSGNSLALVCLYSSVSMPIVRLESSEDGRSPERQGQQHSFGTD